MSGTWAKGATLEVLKGEARVKIAHLTDLSFPDIEVDEIDISSHDSKDGYREFIPGMKDGGAVDIEGNYTSDNAIMDYIDGGEVQEFTITTASNKRVTFKGFFTSFTVDLPYEGKEAFSASIKVSGKVALAQPHKSIGQSRTSVTT